MAGVTFVLVLSLTVCRSVLVFDVVYSSNVVIRALQSITSRGPSKAARSRGPIGIPRQQPAAAAAPATSKVRLVPEIAGETTQNIHISMRFIVTVGGVSRVHVKGGGQVAVSRNSPAAGTQHPGEAEIDPLSTPPQPKANRSEVAGGAFYLNGLGGAGEYLTY